jgi:ATP-dependent Lon protease
VYAQHGNVISRDMRKEILGTTDLFHMANQIAANLPMEDEKKQELLEARISRKSTLLMTLLSNEIEISRIREEIRRI